MHEDEEARSLNGPKAARDSDSDSGLRTGHLPFFTPH